jgi:hypothetical protein
MIDAVNAPFGTAVHLDPYRLEIEIQWTRC